MKMSLEGLKNLGYEIKTTGGFRKTNLRKFAKKGEHQMLQCTSCPDNTFHDLDDFHSNKTAFLGRSNYCTPCTKKKQTKGGGTSVSIGIKRFDFANNEKLSFKLEPFETGTIIVFAVGNSFEWNRANQKVYSHIAYARDDIYRISSEMGTDMDRVL